MVRLGGFAFLLALLWASWASAQDRLLPLASTPDIALGATATTDVQVPGQRARWVYIKNDCASDIYFDLRGGSGDAATDFPLNLGQNQSFQAQMSVRTVGASASAAAAGACTFTVQFAD